MCADSPAPYAHGPRGIDHLVIAGRDLSALEKEWRALGFQVGARNRHPWGTENHIVQFGGCFLELIGIGAKALIPARAGRTYSFGRFVKEYLGGGEGLAMLALESRDAQSDAQAFQAARIGDFEPFFFERTAKRLDGGDVRVAFSLAFAEMRGANRAGFFVCQQHEPQNFWSPQLQVHPNGATGIERVTLVADDPSDCHEFLGAFIGQRAMRATSLGLELDTGRGLVEVLSPDGFRFRFGRDIDPNAGPQFGAITFTSPDLSEVLPHLAKARAAFRREDDNRLICTNLVHGVTLAFCGTSP